MRLRLGLRFRRRVRSKTRVRVRVRLRRRPRCIPRSASSPWPREPVSWVIVRLVRYQLGIAGK